MKKSLWQFSRWIRRIYAPRGPLTVTVRMVKLREDDPRLKQCECSWEGTVTEK